MLFRKYRILEFPLKILQEDKVLVINECKYIMRLLEVDLRKRRKRRKEKEGRERKNRLTRGEKGEEEVSRIKSQIIIYYQILTQI